MNITLKKYDRFLENLGINSGCLLTEFYNLNYMVFASWFENFSHGYFKDILLNRSMNTTIVQQNS